MRYLLFLLLAGCAVFDEPRHDARRTDVEITVVKRDNLPSPYDRPDLKMWGTYHCYTDKKCTIWIPTGNSACAKEVEAHERRHVEFGLYHDEDFRLRECNV